MEQVSYLIHSKVWQGSGNVVQWVRTGMAIWLQHSCEYIWVVFGAIDIVIIRVEHVCEEEDSSGDEHKVDGTSTGHWFMMGPPNRLHSLTPSSSRVKCYVLNSSTSKGRFSFWSKNKTWFYWGCDWRVWCEWSNSWGRIRTSCSCCCCSWQCTVAIFWAYPGIWSVSRFLCMMS